MDALDVIAMSTALVVLLAVVIAKAVTTRGLNRLRYTIGQITQQRARMASALHSVQASRKFTEQRVEMLRRKKTELEKRATRLRREVSRMRNGGA